MQQMTALATLMKQLGNGTKKVKRKIYMISRSEWIKRSKNYVKDE